MLLQLRLQHKHQQSKKEYLIYMIRKRQVV
jgi:hypothetical protein